MIEKVSLYVECRYHVYTINQLNEEIWDGIDCKKDKILLATDFQSQRVN